MKKITLVSIISILFFLLSSFSAYLFRFGECDNKWAFFGIGIFLMLISILLAVTFKKFNGIVKVCLIMNSISLGLLIRAWYIFCGYDNPLWMMLLIGISPVILLLIYYLLTYIPFFDRHPVLLTILFIIFILIIYIVIVATTKTTYISTFGFYMIVQFTFIIGLCIESGTYSELMKNMLYCSYSILIVAIIMGLLMLIGDGGDFDLGLDGLDFGSGSGSSETRKTRRELEREVINVLKDVDIF